MLRFFAAGAAAPRIEDRDRVDATYRQLRIAILVTLVATYGISYTARLGLGVVKGPLLEDGIFTATELGWIGSAFFWGYAAGKLINGFIADRVNVRVFIPTGLAVSAIVNLFMGSNSLVFTAVALWGINGWFQGFGNPASVISLTHWFSPRERGTTYGIWSSAHAIGEGLTFIGTSALVGATMWRFAFWGPGMLCLVTAVAAFFVLRDRPETLGLPPVSEWKGDVAEGTASQARPAGLALLRTQLSLLRLPQIWVIGLASMSMYVTRYAINSWGVLYLEEAHGLSTETAASLVGLNALVGIGGCVAYGVLSDRLFSSRRPPLTLLFGHRRDRRAPAHLFRAARQYRSPGCWLCRLRVHALGPVGSLGRSVRRGRRAASGDRRHHGSHRGLQLRRSRTAGHCQRRAHRQCVSSCRRRLEV